MIKKIGMSTRQKILTCAFLRTVQFHKNHHSPNFRKKHFFGSKVKPQYRFFSKLKKMVLPIFKKIKKQIVSDQLGPDLHLKK